MKFKEVKDDLEKGATPTDEEGLAEYFDVFMELLWSAQYEKYEELLGSINIKECSGLLLHSILRLAYSHQLQLPSYDKTLSDVREELISRGEDAETELMGLDHKITKEQELDHHNFLQQLNIRK